MAIRILVIFLWTFHLANTQFNIRAGLQPVEVTTARTRPTTTIDRLERLEGILDMVDHISASVRNPTTRRPPGFRRTTTPKTKMPNKPKKNIFKTWLKTLEEQDYDKYLIPKIDDNRPLVVTVSIMIIRVHSVSDSSMDYGIEMYYRERWHDHRLSFDPDTYDGETVLNLPMAAVNHTWRPDTYFLNAISAEVDNENSVTHRAFFRLNYTGDVHFSRNHSKEDLIYTWSKIKGTDVELKDPIQLPEFYVHPKDIVAVHPPPIMYTTGEFDNLELCLPLKRSAGFCVLQVFIPATAVVMSSWVALWMAEETTFSDVLAVILAIIFLAYAYNSVMPRVSYPKLLDWYMCSCFLFVFLSLAKLVIIKYFCKKWAKEGGHTSDWFLAQMAGATMAQQQQKEDEDVEKGGRGRRRDSCRSDTASSNSLIVQKKSAKLVEANGPFSLMVPVPSIKVPEKRRVRILDDDDSESGDEYESVLDKNSLGSSLMMRSKMSEDSIDHFLDTPVANKEESNEKKDDDDKQSSSSEKGSHEKINDARRMTFLGLEAWSAWFQEKSKNKETELERRMRYLRWFHVVTQLALPIGFAVFFIFLLLIYPTVYKSQSIACSTTR